MVQATQLDHIHSAKGKRRQDSGGDYSSPESDPSDNELKHYIQQLVSDFLDAVKMQNHHFII